MIGHHREVAACLGCRRPIYAAVNSTRRDAGYCGRCWGKKFPPKRVRPKLAFEARCISLSCAGCAKTFLRLRWEYEARQRYGQQKFYCSLSCFATHSRFRMAA